jgi:hypothetical protein
MADAAADLEEGGLVRTVKDLFAGAAGGIAQVLLGEFKILFPWLDLLLFLYWVTCSTGELYCKRGSCVGFCCGREEIYFCIICCF